MPDIIFSIVFPLVLLAFLIIIFVSGFSKTVPEQQFMSLDEFIKDWLKDHGQAHKLDEQFAKMKKDPSGAFYMPITYKGAKLFIKWGLSANKVSFINLIMSFFIFYGVIMASDGHNLGLLFTVQPLYGSWFILLALLVLFTGIIDGIDGAIARLLNKKSKSGAWLDNVIDRVSDILMLVCLIPYGFSGLLNLELNFIFICFVWTNIFIIFIYEYMRARHEGLGLHETKPYPGERITRVLVTTTFFLIYGISSFVVLLTILINPSTITFWTISHSFVVTWIMLIFQITLFVIMTSSSILLGKYSFQQLKKMD
ncbi:MAG: CDP-alcohol phosphatidyltransferase family protein [Promethearchaeota archaeon]